MFGYVSESNTSASCGNCEYGTHVLNFVCQLSEPSIVSQVIRSTVNFSGVYGVASLAFVYIDEIVCFSQILLTQAYITTVNHL